MYILNPNNLVEFKWDIWVLNICAIYMSTGSQKGHIVELLSLTLLQYFVNISKLVFRICIFYFM